MQFFRLRLFAFGDIFNGRFATFSRPSQLLHQDDVNKRVEVSTGIQGILNGHNLWTINCLQVLKNLVVITLVVIKLIHEENNGLLQLFGITEVVLSSYFRTKLTVNKQHSRVGYVKRSQSSTNEVITTRAVNDVQLLALPFSVEYCWEYRVSVIVLNREVVTHRILLSDTSAATDLTTMIKQRLCQSGLTRSIITKQGNVLDFLRIVNFHGIYFLQLNRLVNLGTCFKRHCAKFRVSQKRAQVMKNILLSKREWICCIT